MNKRFLIGLFLAVTLILWRFYFNVPSEETAVIQGTARALPYEVRFAYTLNESEKKKASHIIDNAFQTIDSLYAEVSKLNNLSSFAAVPISEDLERLFLLIDRVHFLTKGLFDPTTPPALKRWEEILKQRDASSEEVDLIKSSMGWSKIHFRGRVFYKEHTQIQISIDSIIKGYLVDFLVQNLQEEGFQNMFIQWADVAKAHGKDNDKPWETFEQTLNNNAFVTSEHTPQNWKIQDCGKSGTFCHIVNPLQWILIKQTKESVCKASVQLTSAGLADGVQYTLFSMTKPEAVNLAESIKKELNEGEFWIFSCEEVSHNSPPRQ